MDNTILRLEEILKETTPSVGINAVLIMTKKEMRRNIATLGQLPVIGISGVSEKFGESPVHATVKRVVTVNMVIWSTVMNIKDRHVGKFNMSQMAKLVFETVAQDKKLVSIDENQGQVFEAQDGLEIPLQVNYDDLDEMGYQGREADILMQWYQWYDWSGPENSEYVLEESEGNLPPDYRNLVHIT